MNNLKPIQNKFIFLLPALISFLIAVYMFLESQSLGFPDGHFTDLAKALILFYKIAIPISLLFLISFLLMSFSPVLKRKIRIIILYGFSISIITGIIIFYYLKSALDDGIGG